MNKNLQDIIDEMIYAANDSNNLSKYTTPTLENWKRIYSDLETVHYFCMDARRIVRRRIKSAELLRPSVEKAGRE
jgi:hypothetical protein